MIQEASVKRQKQESEVQEKTRRIEQLEEVLIQYMKRVQELEYLLQYERRGHSLSVSNNLSIESF